VPEKDCQQMGDGFHLFDIILFAAIAGVLLLRLRSVLGRRTGNERRIDPFAQHPPAIKPAAGPFAAPAPVTIDAQAEPVAAAVRATPGARAIKSADPGFDEAAFLKGARGAFAIVVNAFAAGDAAALKPLLSPEILAQFTAAIRARGSAAKQTSPLVAIKSAEISSSAIEGATALVTVKFTSEQNAPAEPGTAIPATAAPGTTEEHVDAWTFSRRVDARDPNWLLIATQSPDAV
jgi:predicted lipid-binding transport protein (Tim44 family)